MGFGVLFFLKFGWDVLGACPCQLLVPVGNDCETFWDKDHLTNSCYQFNFQSTLSWREAWNSCEQQGANLLSITEIHEQTYINGERGGPAMAPGAELVAPWLSVAPGWALCPGWVVWGWFWAGVELGLAGAAGLILLLSLPWCQGC